MRERLVYEATGKPVQVGDVVKFDDGTSTKVLRIEGRRHPGSTGRIWVEDKGMVLGERGYFPSVFGAEWRDVVQLVGAAGKDL